MKIWTNWPKFCKFLLNFHSFSYRLTIGLEKRKKKRKKKYKRQIQFRGISTAELLELFPPFEQFEGVRIQKKMDGIDKKRKALMKKNLVAGQKKIYKAVSIFKSIDLIIILGKRYVMSLYTIY
jgi:hypothetical protein